MPEQLPSQPLKQRREPVTKCRKRKGDSKAVPMKVVQKGEEKGREGPSPEKRQRLSGSTTEAASSSSAPAQPSGYAAMIHHHHQGTSSL
jgi:hypothetical protein